MLYPLPRLLVVDDEPRVCRLVERIALNAGYVVDIAHDVDAAAALLKDSPAQLIVLDLSMPGRDGIDFLRDIATTVMAPPIVLISGLPDGALESARLMAMQYGLSVIGTEAKPLSLPRLEHLLRHARSTVVDDPSGESSPHTNTDDLRTDFAPVYRIDRGRYMLAGMRAKLPVAVLEENTEKGYAARSPSEMRLVRNLTDNLLLEIVARLHEWRRQGISLFGVVDVAPSLLNDDDIARRLAALLDEYDISHDRLVLDVSEADVASLTPNSHEALRLINKAGFQILCRFSANSTSSMQQICDSPATGFCMSPTTFATHAGNDCGKALLAAIVILAKRANLSTWYREPNEFRDVRIAMDLGFDFIDGRHLSMLVRDDPSSIVLDSFRA